MGNISVGHFGGTVQGYVPRKRPRIGGVWNVGGLVVQERFREVSCSFQDRGNSGKRMSFAAVRSGGC